MSDKKSSLVIVCLAVLCGMLLQRVLQPASVQAQAPAQDSSVTVQQNRYVAVAGEYQSGVALLYVLDQEQERLAVYEARGGAANSRRVALVGVRNVALDTELDGFNDESDYSFQDLEELLDRRGVKTD